MSDSLFRRTSVDELVARAYACLAEDDAQGALKLARRIEKRRHTSAFEIGGLALQALGRRDEAIAWLERGVELAPSVWLNWQLLGNLRSEDGDYDGARAAYERALECPKVWRASVALNRAVAESADGRFETSLEALKSIEDAEVVLRAAGARCHALRRLERHVECIAEATRALASPRAADANSNDDLDALAYVAAQQILARLAQDESRNELRRDTLDALKCFAPHVQLLDALRQIDARSSPHAQTFALLVNTKFDVDPSTKDRPSGCYTSFEVVAESREQAAEFAIALERATSPWPAEFKVDDDDAQARGPAPGVLLGVVRCSGRVFFD